MDKLRKLLRFSAILLVLFSCGQEDPVDDDDLPPLVPPLGASGTFLEVGSLATARRGHKVVTVAGGDVLFTGGWDAAGQPLATAELYEYMRGTFFATGGIAGGMYHPRVEHTATALPDGRVLIAGGWDGTALVGEAEIYNPLTHGFTRISAPMIHPRRCHTAVRLASGNVLLVGGEGSAGMVLSFCEVYHYQSGIFEKVSVNLNAARHSSQASLLPDGRVVIAGGVNASDVVLSSVEIFTPAPGNDASGTLLITEAMPEPRVGHCSISLGTGAASGTPVFFHGTSQLVGPVPLFTALHFDPNKYAPGEGFWIATGLAARYGHTATLLLDGQRVLLAGGTYPSAPAIFDAYGGGPSVSSGTFTLTQNPSVGVTTFAAVTHSRSGHSASLLPNGTVLLAGGLNGPVVTATAEIYSP